MQQNKQPSRRPGRTALVLLIAAALAGAGGFYGWQRVRPEAAATQAAKAPPPIPVTLASVERQPFNRVLDGLGTVQAFNTVQVRTRVDGEVQRIAFKEGQTVRRGDILAEIDPRPYQAALDQAKAKKVQDEANLKNAKADLDRYTRLGEFASRQQTDTQASTVNQLTAQIAADQGAIDNAQTQLSYATIRSPLDGITGFRQVDAGNIVNASAQTAIVTITQVEPIFVVFTAPEEQLPRIMAALAKGTVPVEARSTDGLTKLSEGRLDLVNNQVDTATGTIRLKAAFANADHALWPGLSVSTRMRLGIVRDALTIPDDAVQHGPSGLFVFVVGPDNEARQQAITVSGSSDGRTLVTDGLAAGDRVIQEGQYRVQPGSRVAEARARETAQAAPRPASPSQER
ncbi:efflux RND transporter periplasmic adaptor subunit [Methylobacterium planeticum]|uniref:Efflux RND transporter periplasmic adaptor subunit n=2 Tax=Methylobacterium planeticum TaxID=2615211 RepID=A0A6N6MS46_9HYPH|nr:efflux RND transporter periplasmic adaptor subunit [Methylobacterium planeticum]KAB1072355.1 efflux RND transporter periplasmic adaptor subunit [Methylobacterium planeticum]